MGEVIGIISVAFIAPLVIVLHYVTKWRESKSLSTEDEKMLQDLWDNAQRMESRINTLETILDDQVPEWRKKV
ncbi:MAG: envelope stress response membrane protein PspB [Chromatiales bacterium]|jgi:phage shock protein B|nr:envelope stress response membrane protein PspB [Chromatiales bacterium]MDH4014670.1 envelope stress response membrane protein PspB [Chromatiales bacterium]PLX57447.1 MAG: envelope stress response membrane protein PspB [Chromatiales bacterium]